MINFIARKFGLGDKIELLKVVEGNMNIDLDMCVQMFLVKTVDEKKRKFLFVD